MRGRRASAGAILAIASLVAAACGGNDNGEGSSTAQTVDEGVKAGVDQALAGSSTTAASATPAKPRTMEEWEALADEERAAIVQKIKDNKWGKSADGKTLTGPDGFKIDLSKCPSGWSDTEGTSDSEIKIGYTTALSGTAADFGNQARAMAVVLDYYSNKGAFTDAAGKSRKVSVIIKDDAYDPARTIPLVDELIDSEKVFAMVTLGSPNALKIYDKLNQRCIAHPLVPTGHPAWADPVNHPWTTGLQVAYSTEAVLWGAFIEQRLSEFPDGKVKVASLVASTDYGRIYDVSFRAYIAQSPNKDRFEYFTESTEITAPNIKDPMTTIASKQPDVFILMSGAVQCTQAIQEAAENGMKQTAKYLLTSQNCKSASYVSKEKVGGDGSAADGWWIVGGGIRDMNSPSEDDNPYMVWARELLRSAGLDPKASGNYVVGFEAAFPLAQAIRIAGQLDGGVTRSNLILALRTMEMTHPVLLDGIKFNMSGNKDAYFIEGSEIARYDSAKQQWVQQGPIVDLSGKSQLCAFDQATASCR